MTFFNITIDDADALDAMNVEIQHLDNEGIKLTPDEYLSYYCTTRHVGLREIQLRTAARAKAEQDPDVLALQQRQTAKL